MFGKVHTPDIPKKAAFECPSLVRQRKWRPRRERETLEFIFLFCHGFQWMPGGGGGGRRKRTRLTVTRNSLSCAKKAKKGLLLSLHLVR